MVYSSDRVFSSFFLQTLSRHCVELAFSLALMLCALAFLPSALSGERPFDPHATVVLVTREEGSGTRSAFVSCADITDCTGIDCICDDAIVAGGSAAIIAAVSQQPCAIGYAPLCVADSAPDTRIVAIDGVMPSADTLRSGSYPLSRHFIAAALPRSSSDCISFMHFLRSQTATTVIKRSGYCAPAEVSDLALTERHGDRRLTVCCSTSAAPLVLMLLQEWSHGDSTLYELHRSDSSTALKMLFSGVCDIAILSRELTDDEAARSVNTAFALDAIAVIVNRDNPIVSLTLPQLAMLYDGSYPQWSYINEDM